MPPSPPLRHLMTLADLPVGQINRIVEHAFKLKQLSKAWRLPPSSKINGPSHGTLHLPSNSLFGKTIALIFSQRSTRTRVAAETSVALLGGHSMFLGREDIQMGVNESIRDTAKIVSGMCQGLFDLARYSDVPVINALSPLWHPTQVLADIMTLRENASSFGSPHDAPSSATEVQLSQLPELPPLTIAYVGDSANVLHDMLVSYPRMGHKFRVASPKQHRAPSEVWERVKQLGCDGNIVWVEDPKEAVEGANVVATDTWISMGQESEKEARLRAFEGYQVTEALCKNAHPEWKFLHCLPRKPQEVDDEVMYGPRSLVFQEGENRKWTTMAIFDILYGEWSLETF
ncbi:hypothetical protein D9613_010049 [Agrocybe pediades]|uniref:ornithine carbamoyltransferase n=1 Tax=Agrocybe pediades TaxID=84607 RepID=A0A8H4QWQ6_9AGAR|nr:hypothetical protein D9613_010049 [Agrocybe pediades]